MAGKIGAAGAVILLLAASLAFGETAKYPKEPRGPAPGDRKGVYRLDEVKILGSVERPGVLFFLPRAKFRLLPLRDRHDWKERIRRDDRGTGEFPE